MKLASLPQGSKGRLIVVSDDLAWYADAGHIVPTLQGLLDAWERHLPALEALATDLAHEVIPQQRFHEREAAAPLPGDGCRGARYPIVLAEDGAGCGFAAGLCVVTGEVAQGATAGQAMESVRLVGMVNQVTPDGDAASSSTAFSPVFVTVNELGPAWSGGSVDLPLLVAVNGEAVGPAGSSKPRSFGELIARDAAAGPIAAGAMFVAADEQGALRYGDTVRIEMRDARGKSIFGAIEQEVARP